LQMGKVLAGFLAAAVLVGGGLSWFASSSPDGLEWSLARVLGHDEPEAPDQAVYRTLASVQEKTAILPDYAFKEGDAAAGGEEAAGAWPAVNGGTTASGLVGGTLTLIIAAALGLLFRRRSGTA